jgi:uncharacterized membrane protein
MDSNLHVMAAAAAFWFGIHAIVSGHLGVRGALVAKIGERGFRGLFSLLSVVALAWIIMAYVGAPVVEVFQPTKGMKHLSFTLVLIAFLFAVLGVLTPNPSSVGQELLLARENPAVGIQRVTRHPFLWGVMLWSAGHLISNGDAASLLFFGSFLLTAAVGTVQIDAKRRRLQPDNFARYEAATSNLPFAAILSKRTKIALGEIGYWRIAVALGLYGVALYLHTLFGHSPYK